MGKKGKKKSRGPTKEKKVVTPSPKNIAKSNKLIDEPVQDGVLIEKERKHCAHIEKGVDLEKLSAKIANSGPVNCEECRQSVVDKRGSKGKGNHGKKKGSAPVDSKSEKAVWICLECGQFSCGGIGLPVTPNCHAVKHVRQTRHPLAVNCENPQICWCFTCRTLIRVEKVEGNGEQGNVLSDVLKLLKGRLSEEGALGDVEDVWFGGTVGSITSEIKSGTPSLIDSHGRTGYVVRGMVNLGNTCFFNSIMQNLLAVGRLRESFFKLEECVGPLSSSLKKLYAETNPESGAKYTINPRSFFGCICSKAPQFRGYQQHDSHELLRCLLDGLSTEELAAKKHLASKGDRNVSDKGTSVDALFGGQISSTVCCLECGHSSTVYEPFLDLSLPVPTKKHFPKKAQQASRARKTKMPPKKGGKTRFKANKDADILPVQGLSTQSISNESSFLEKSDAPVAGEVTAASGGSRLTVATDTTTMADKGGTVLPISSASRDSDHVNVFENTADMKSSSPEDLTWLDYVELDNVFYEHDITPQSYDVSVTQDALSKDESLNEVSPEASSSTTEQGSLIQKEPNEKVDSSTMKVCEDEASIQVQDSEVLLLPYKEESSSIQEIAVGEGAASSSAFASGQDGLEFDGFGDLFNEPEIAFGPSPRPSSASEVTETGFMAGNSSESDPDEVDDTDSLVSVESCLAHFIKPELLSNENAWHCESCSKRFQCQKLDEKKKAKAASVVLEDGGAANSCPSEDSSCFAEVRSLSNGETKDAAVEECAYSHDEEIGASTKDCSKLDNGQAGRTNGVVHQYEPGTSEVKGACLDELQSSRPSKSFADLSTNYHGANIVTSKAHESGVKLSLDKNDELEGSEDEVDSGSLKVKRDATKRVLIHEAPPILTVHLKRFSQDACGRLSKLNGHVSFRDTIDLRPYMDPRCIKEENYEYHLVGVVEHIGSMRGGHYVAYVRGGESSRGRKDGDENASSSWYQANDAYVREVSLQEVINCEAYILFYEKT